MESVNITIIGAGIIGLACAAELSIKFSDIVVIEKNSSFGQETSSRNSEVIHAGIYYPKGSLKAKFCIEARDLLYDYCSCHNINYKRIGKLIVAINQDEIPYLEALFKNGKANGISDLEFLAQEEVKKLEPNINAIAAIYSPSTGIFDSHGVMKSFESQALRHKVIFAYATELLDLKKQKQGFEIITRDAQGNNYSFTSKIVINASGFNSDKVANMIGIKSREYILTYCKGNYFRVHHNKGRFISHLIYPVPSPKSVSLGIHTVLDLAGGMRLGPDAEYVDKIDYTVNELNMDKFYDSAHTFLPFIEPCDLSPDIAGIRAKLQGPGENFRDFVINEESDKGFPGLINLIGIDSPGLTCCLSIAREVKRIISQ